MTTITLPPDLEEVLADVASRSGTTPELLAIRQLRRIYSLPSADVDGGGTLFDFIKDYIGTVSGSSEPISENGGRLFAEALAAEHATRARS